MAAETQLAYIQEVSQACDTTTVENLSMNRVCITVGVAWKVQWYSRKQARASADEWKGFVIRPVLPVPSELEEPHAPRDEHDRYNTHHLSQSSVLRGNAYLDKGPGRE